MSDLYPVLAPVMYAYFTVILGTVTALTLRAWFRRGGQLPSIEQAAGCAWLPVLALVTLIIASILPSSTQEPENALHQAWHTWAAAVTLSHGLHNALHALNLSLLIFAGGAVVWTVFTMGRLCALMASLRNTPAEETIWNGQTFAKLETAQLVCFTMGMFRPRVYVSSALLGQVTSRHCDAMFAHEIAHLRRRDGLTGMVLSVFYALFPLPGTKMLVREWQHAAERACDEAAARQLGDPCAVAEALVEVTRLVSHPATSGIACFAGTNDVEERVTSLLTFGLRENRTAHSRFVMPFVAFALCFMGFLTAETFIRHLVELFVHH